MGSMTLSSSDNKSFSTSIHVNAESPVCPVVAGCSLVDSSLWPSSQITHCNPAGRPCSGHLKIWLVQETILLPFIIGSQCPHYWFFFTLATREADIWLDKKKTWGYRTGSSTNREKRAGLNDDNRILILYYFLDIYDKYIDTWVTDSDVV